MSVIAQDETVAMTNAIARKTAPVERVLGLISLATCVINNLLPAPQR